jgi:hypothetical protein
VLAPQLVQQRLGEVPLASLADRVDPDSGGFRVALQGANLREQALQLNLQNPPAASS